MEEEERDCPLPLVEDRLLVGALAKTLIWWGFPLPTVEDRVALSGILCGGSASKGWGIKIVLDIGDSSLPAVVQPREGPGVNLWRK